MERSPGVAHRFHPEPALLVVAVALLVAVLAGFVLGVMATAGLRASPAVAHRPAAQATPASGLQPADSRDGALLETRREYAAPAPRS